MASTDRRAWETVDLTSGIDDADESTQLRPQLTLTPAKTTALKDSVVRVSTDRV